VLLTLSDFVILKEMFFFSNVDDQWVREQGYMRMDKLHTLLSPSSFTNNWSAQFVLQQNFKLDNFAGIN